MSLSRSFSLSSRVPVAEIPLPVAEFFQSKEYTTGLVVTSRYGSHPVA